MVIVMKHCNKCDNTKEYSAFNKDASIRDGYKTVCRSCQSVTRKAFYLNNKESENKQSKSNYWSNPEAYRRRSAKTRALNPERARAACRAWRDKKSPLYVANKRRGHAKRRAAKRYATVSWSVTAMITTVYRDAVEMELLTGIKFHVDHIIPLQGKLVSGLHVENNLQILMAHENELKSNHYEIK